MTNFKQVLQILQMKTIYKVSRENGELIMFAPLSTIQQVYRLHDDAVVRVASEGGVVTLYGNGRHENIVLVSALVKEL